MQRSSGTTKSTPHLPPHVAPGFRSTNQQQNKNRKALSASISAAALLHANEPPGDREKPGFAITDLLESPSGDDKKHLSLSPIKQIAQHQSVPVPQSISPSAFNIFTGTSQQQTSKPSSQYLQRLDDPENVELFAYASTLCHRITGRYLPRTLLQTDANAQKREIERMQQDPEILRAIATIRVRLMYQ